MKRTLIAISIFAVAAPAIAEETAPPALAPLEAPAPATSPPAAQAIPAPNEAPPTAGAPGQPTPEQVEEFKKIEAVYDQLDKQTGVISLAGGKVRLNVPGTHYFIGAADARRVLTEVWGNPPEAADGVEGMLFLSGANPAHDQTWGAVLQYSDEGHVKDDDAAKIKYDELLADMQKSTREESEARKAQGYPSMELVGWAEPPHYDPAKKKLYWAKALQVEGAEQQTLNYDIRVLGREGVFVISFISGMDGLPSIRDATPTVLSMAEFTDSNRYADYKSGDKTAAYGIGGLIAGGAAMAVAKKAGLLGLLLAFGKKGIVLFGVALVALANWFRGLLGKKKDPPAD